MRTDQNTWIDKKELVPNGEGKKKKNRLVCRKVLEEGGKEEVGKKEPLNL